MGDVKAVPIMWSVIRGGEPIGFVELSSKRFEAAYAPLNFSRTYDLGNYGTLGEARGVIEMIDEASCRTCRHHGKEIFGDRKNTCEIETEAPDELWSGVIDCRDHEPEGGRLS